MAYVVLDPTDDYAAHMMRFLARAGHGAVAVFTSRKREQLWRLQWADRVGHTVLGAYLGPAAPTVEALATEIRARFPQLSGVVTWDETHVLYGAALGEALGLDWNPVAVIARCRDKGLLKEWIRARSDLRVNASAVVTTAEEALAFQRHLGRWPVVVKPTGGAGATDVTFPRSEAELLRRCQQVREGGNGRVLLEEYVGGAELAVNGLSDGNADVLVTDVWLYDRRHAHGVDNVCLSAAKVSSGSSAFQTVARYAADVVEVLGLRRCPFHMEVKVDDGGPCLIEVGARFGGGELPTLASTLHGRDLFELAACHFLEDLPLRRSEVDHAAYDAKAARVVLGVQPHRLDRIQAVEGLAEVERLPSFVKLGMLRAPGTVAPKTVDLGTRAWELYLIHPDAEQVARDTERAHALLRYR